ncbi:unnamed protein product [Rhizophagus irregularis]|uniref:BTB domain-containing protein n=1 Tax=Rhizophagus irregularis TaxID=588596 RepID=A0A916EBF3_9GLOM|nr:BTB/POZ protein [Rhizophagus irregularis DAOM 181602=DAOM 197198]CAB4489081.1 unnamed protein product [Rhizophagus irregularis]CAB5193197.1 unnamed protein product [Rhizophagus irregularis]CAB5369414.1 unnamed protein product [Rhizophagus irregularis]
MSAMEFDQNFDSSGGFNKTSLINSHNNINLNPPNFENDDVITLNVGGIKYETYRSTLTSYPETFLGTMFKERNKDLLIPRGKNKNEYFFDRSGELFKYIIQFYRTGKVIIPPEVDTKEMEIELDFFQIPRPISSTIDKIAISKVNELVNTFKDLIKEVAEYYMRKNSFRGFEAEIDICFLDNGQATVKAGLDNTLTDAFESSKHYAYNIMSVYKNEIKKCLEAEYPELTWTDDHKMDNYRTKIPTSSACFANFIFG